MRRRSLGRRQFQSLVRDFLKSELPKKIPMFFKTYFQIARAPARFLTTTWPEMRRGETRGYCGPVEYETAGALILLSLVHVVLGWFCVQGPVATVDSGALPVDRFAQGLHEGVLAFAATPSWIVVIDHVLFAAFMWCSIACVRTSRPFAVYDAFATFAYFWGTFIFPAMLLLLLMASISASSRPVTVVTIEIVTYASMLYILLAYAVGLSYLYSIVAAVDWRLTYWMSIVAFGLSAAWLGGAPMAATVLGAGVAIAPIVYMSRDSLKRVGHIHWGRVSTAMVLGWVLAQVPGYHAWEEIHRKAGSDAYLQGAATGMLCIAWGATKVAWLLLRPINQNDCR